MTKECNGYEWIHNLDLPPLPKFYISNGVDGGLTWDQAGNYPVDFDKLVEAGYCRRVHITHIVEVCE